ncbi:MAG: YdcF family protein [Eubacteriales bacterium]|nr:YdcF family protein [Eubacteriales bacterium]
MERFYRILCIVCAVLAVVCIPFRQLWFGLMFFTALAVCTGAMWVLYRVRDVRTNPSNTLNLGVVTISLAPDARIYRWSTAAKWLVRIGNVVFVLWLVSVAVVEGFILSGAHTDAQAVQADCVFVLGGGIRGDQPTETLRNRLAVALDVMEQNPDAQIIVCGGQGDDETCTEASVMYNWMVSHGGDASRITMESKSRNTIQNIENAQEICAKNGWSTENAAALSSSFHLFRTRHIMEQCGLQPLAIAAPSGNPAMHVLFCIREYFSICKLIFQGYW